MRRFGPVVVAWLVAVLAVGLGGCERSGSGGAGSPDPTVGRTTSTASTAPPIDVSVIPPEITVAYLDAVVDRLDALVGDAFRELVRERAPNRRFLDLLDAVYDGQEFEDKQSVYGEIAADDFENVRADPGDPVTSVQRILKSEPACVIASVDRDFGGFFETPQDASTAGYLALAPRSAGGDPASLNPTAWAVVFDGGTLDNVEPIAAC